MLSTLKAAACLSSPSGDGDCYGLSFPKFHVKVIPIVRYENCGNLIQPWFGGKAEPYG
jgi:hypothetical protein